MEFDFGLKLRVSPNTDHLEIIERLAEAGCDDAVVGIGRSGWLALEFTRGGASAEEAVNSAIADVKRAIPGAELVEVSEAAG